MGNLNGADMAFIIFAAALVMLMVPGLALFYGGLVKSKNVLSTIMHSYTALFVISIVWILIGYTLAFGPDHGGIIGGFDWAFLSNIGIEANADYAVTIPHLLFVIFQMMFAVITAAVISGSVAERMRFPAFVLFIILWSTLVYSPIAHWVWGNGGWLKNLGVLDFAGGNVVEINSGIAGLVAITQGAGFVTPLSAIIIGFIGGIVSFFAIVFLKRKIGYDDALDAFGCHGIVGIWGAIATGLFSSKAVNSAGADGLFYGNFELLKVNMIAAFSCALYAAVATFVILKVINLVTKIRTDKDEESSGLDYALHGEEAYNGVNNI